LLGFIWFCLDWLGGKLELGFGQVFNAEAG
jgi:hypothetical protein